LILKILKLLKLLGRNKEKEYFNKRGFGVMKEREISINQLLLTILVSRFDSWNPHFFSFSVFSFKTFAVQKWNFLSREAF
jgi:hypothetical protein